MNSSATTGASPTRQFRPESVERFRYVGYDLDLDGNRLLCRYALDDLRFEERITFFPTNGSDVDLDALDAAAHIVHLLAGISYYKAAAPAEIVVEHNGLTPAERDLLEAFYLHGLGEYAYRNGLQLTGLKILADDRTPRTTPRPVTRARPLIPFGGGIDSIVTVEGVRDHTPDAALFVVSREADRFEAIETAARVTGLPVVRAERRLDEQILRSRALGFRNGHVPVTGILSAIAVMAAVFDGRDAVVMSNEWSASSGNVEHDGQIVNHQWSKTLEFEDLFRAALAQALPDPVGYFSWLRPFSELWVADRFSRLGGYHRSFRSCNRAFHIDPVQRLDHWCGRCDKCCFIDLILGPFLTRSDLAAVFGGSEPLDDESLLETFRTLVGLSGEIKPFECVGDVDECRVAILLTAEREDRTANPLVQRLAGEVRPLVGDDLRRHTAHLLRPLGPHRIPHELAPADLLD